MMHHFDVQLLCYLHSLASIYCYAVVCRPPASLFLQKLRRKKAGSDGSDADAVITPPSSPLTEGEYSVSCSVSHI